MGLLALGLSFAQPLVVGSLARADSPYRLADAEAALLHRRLDLKGISQYSRVQKRWQPLTLPSARVYVVNLWGVACAPCRAEFPLLRNIQRAWQGQRDVVFVYLADPPLESLPEQIERYWQDGKDALPDADPARCSDETLRRQLGNDAQPITLLLDGQLVVRQAFIGAIGDRPLGAAIARLLAAVPGNRPATRQNPAPAAR
jgi:thiol-disulfide isomerase/thioredoxin